MTENTKRGARGLIPPASTEPGNPAEDTLLPGTVAALQRLGISVREVAVDGGFNVGPTNTALQGLAPKNVYIAGRQVAFEAAAVEFVPAFEVADPALRAGAVAPQPTFGAFGGRFQGRRTWTEWGIPAYDLDTLAVRTR